MNEISKPQTVNRSGISRHSMSRRQMVQALLSGVGAALPAIAAAHPVHKHLANTAMLAAADDQAAATTWSPAFFDAHQNETVIVLAERIVPGSTRAQVNRFLDLALAGDSQENQKKFFSALAAFEGKALERFAKPFKELSATQQDAILTEASSAKSGQAEGGQGADWIAAAAKSASETPRFTLRDHFDYLKGWVVGAYYSSEIGMKELGWTGEHFFESFPGCQHPGGHA